MPYLLFRCVVEASLRDAPTLRVVSAHGAHHYRVENYTYGALVLPSVHLEQRPLSTTLYYIDST